MAANQSLSWFAHGGGRHAVGEQINLAFLDAVLHPAAGAVELLMETAGPPGLGVEVATTKHGLASPCVHSALADPTLLAPALASGPHEVLEASGRLSAVAGLGFGRRQFRGAMAHQPDIAS